MLGSKHSPTRKLAAPELTQTKCACDSSAGEAETGAPGCLLAHQSQFVNTEFSVLATFLKKNCCDKIPCPRQLIKDFGAYGFRGLESMMAKQRHWDRNSQELIIS